MPITPRAAARAHLNEIHAKVEAEAAASPVEVEAAAPAVQVEVPPVEGAVAEAMQPVEDDSDDEPPISAAEQKILDKIKTVLAELGLTRVGQTVAMGWMRESMSSDDCARVSGTACALCVESISVAVKSVRHNSRRNTVCAEWHHPQARAS